MIQWTQATLNTIILAINNRAKIASPTFTGTVSGITKDMVGLNNVTNESKTTMFTNPTFTGVAVLPSTTSIGTVSSAEIGYLDGVTSAIQTQLGTKAPLADPSFSGIVSGVTSAMVGLGSVNNTSDSDKPVSTATQTALNLKANLSSPALTGTPTAPTASSGTNNTQLATTGFTCAMAGGSTVPALSNSQNGYMKMANGIIIQWGLATDANNVNSFYTTTFPIAFPNQCLSISTQSKSKSGSQVDKDMYFDVITTSTTNFVILCNGDGGYYNNSWIAIGY